ncbi:hypothetical protein AGR7C_Cc30011 [Agrobacterium deltaense Zutra 3/1]|uniref:Uncharacterized protein n=1 Tax=Agrobacterium deltaense Zutra 3/1 TaxID=1183427 RepID=A0A1S7QGW6_9HYPH|nr:hypothetical protein AGR7C_Cc30011 [Agrobacterium deltaense Zutra 3/1]
MSHPVRTAIEEWLPIFHRTAEQDYRYYNYDRGDNQRAFEDRRRRAYDDGGRKCSA